MSAPLKATSFGYSLCMLPFKAIAAGAWFEEADELIGSFASTDLTSVVFAGWLLLACAACCEAVAVVVFLNKLFAGFEGWASLFDVAFCCDEVTFFDVVVVASSFLPDASVDVLFAAPFFALSVFLALPGYCFYSAPVSLLWTAALADDVVLAEAGGLNFRREEFGGLWSPGGFRRPVLLLLCLDSGRCGC